MSSVGTVISYPIPAYSNVPIEPQFYQPSRFEISAISTGSTTTVTTTEDHNYVVGQLVRLLIPVPYGIYQLNNNQGYVISVPTTTQVVIDIDSTNYNSYISSPFTATISNITKANPGVITISNSVYGNSILITGVGGMTQLNNNIYQIEAQNATSITINQDTTNFSNYTSGGTITVYPVDDRVSQIIAIGDVNSGGQINSSSLPSQPTAINGSFINISPL